MPPASTPPGKPLAAAAMFAAITAAAGTALLAFCAYLLANLTVASAPKGKNRRRPAGGPGTLAHFEAWSSRLTLEGGKPFVLEDFQRKILRSYFGGAREVLVLLPKKNGKTTLMAALALYHLCTTPDAACYIAASSRDQAGIMFAQAVGFIRRSPGLQARVRAYQGYREVRSRRDGGFIRVLAADADTADGVIPTLALVDELHRHKSSDLYGVFRDGLGPRNGRIVTISTAGSDEESALGVMRRSVLAHGAKRRGAYTTAKSPDGTFVLHEYSLAPTEDLENLRLVKRANPASFMTLAELRRRRDSPSMTRHQWARFACNVWAQDDEAAISALDWHRRSAPGVEIPEGEEITLGMDLGWKRDTTALVPVWERLELTEAELDRLRPFPGMNPGDLMPVPEAAGGGRQPWVPSILRAGAPAILTPPGDGRLLEEALVWNALVWFSERYRVRVVMDPNADGQRFAQRIERELGLEVIEHSQKPAPMALAASRLSEAVRAGTIEHPDHPELNAQVLAARAKWLSGEAWMLTKPRTKKPVDAAVALAMAVSVAQAPRKTELRPFVL